MSASKLFFPIKICVTLFRLPSSFCTSSADSFTSAPSPEKNVFAAPPPAPRIAPANAPQGPPVIKPIMPPCSAPPPMFCIRSAALSFPDARASATPASSATPPATTAMDRICRRVIGMSLFMKSKNPRQRDSMGATSMVCMALPIPSNSCDTFFVTDGIHSNEPPP